MAIPAEPHVLLIGAGVSGLLIAHGLQKANIKYTIFEAEEEGLFRPREWTMGIHWGLPLMEGLLPPDKAARIPTDGAVDPFIDYTEPPNNGAYIFDGVSGELLKELTVPDRIVRVSRRKLRALLREDVDVKYGHVLENLECNDHDATVTATFANGSRYTGTIVVGSDGPRSAVRNYLFRSDPVKAELQSTDDLYYMSMAATFGEADTPRLIRSAAHPVWFLTIHPKLMLFVSLQDVPDPEKPEDWKFFFYPTVLKDETNGTWTNFGMREMKESAKLLAEPFRTMLLNIPDDTVFSSSPLTYWVAESWSTEDGRITLAGDAAHPMPPFRGQGGNHAIQDAHNLVEVLKQLRDANWDKDLQRRLMTAYSDEVAKRGAAETALSIKNGRMLMAYDDFKNSPYAKQGLVKNS